MNLDKRTCLTRSLVCVALLVSACGLALQHSQALAQTAFDTPTLTPAVVGRWGVTLTVTAGPSGAPGGFTVYWMTLADFVANGSDWDYADSMGVVLEASFTGTPTKHTAGGTISSYVLGPNQTVTVEVGDLFDETGVTTIHTNELVPGIAYVVCAYANEFGGTSVSGRSTTSERTTDVQNDCLFSPGYWKNHESEWPVSVLTLGTVSYTKAQLLAILNTPAQGNGLIFLAHQLIATKLNLAAGASGTVIAPTVAAADLLIDGLVIPPVGAGYLDPSLASGLTNTMDDYNNGELGTDPCQPVPVENTTWGQLKVRYF